MTVARTCLALVATCAMTVAALAQSPVTGTPSGAGAPPIGSGGVTPPAPSPGSGPVISGAPPALPAPAAPPAAPALPAAPPAAGALPPPKQARPLPQGEFWIQIASRQDVAEALTLAQAYARAFPRTTVFQSQNGWYAIVVDTVRQGAVQQTLDAMKASGRIPPDSYATSGKSFVSLIWP